MPLTIEQEHRFKIAVAAQGTVGTLAGAALTGIAVSKGTTGLVIGFGAVTAIIGRQTTKLLIEITKEARRR